MSKIEIKFKEGKESSGIEAKTVKKMKVIEEESKPPKILLHLSKEEYQTLKDLHFCDIKIDGKLFFKGKVSQIILEKPSLKVTLTAIFPNDEPQKENLNQDLLEKFKEENPELFTNISPEEFLKTGEKVKTNIIRPEKSAIEIDDDIIEGSLKIEESTETPISEVSLHVKAAWLSRREGSVNLSTKIENRFKMARVNTLTSRKLEDSWPKFGDRISSNGSASTKYMIASSRLREIEQQVFPSITIDELIPRLKMRRHVYENRLVLAWDFEQYMNETIDINIHVAPKLSKNLNNPKKININLKNVQEYVENPYESSFFKTPNGNLILNAIIKSIGDFIVLSWRNIEASCELIDNEQTINLSCKDWIKIGNQEYKITQIDREIECNKILTKIKARSFGIAFPSQEYIQDIELAREEQKMITAEDVLEDISVSNDSDIQYDKLLKFISEKRSTGSINKGNYKSLLNNFLNANQTKIQIVTKPLKTEHCEKKQIGPIDLYFCGEKI